MQLKKLYIAFLINAIIVLTIGYSYFNYVQNINYPLAKIYYVGAFLGHFLSLAAIPLAISSIIYKITNKKALSNFIFGMLSALLLIALKVDTLVYSQFRFHLSPFVFDMAFGKNAGDIFHVDTTNSLKIIGGVLAVILLQILILYIAKKIIKNTTRLFIKPTLLLLFLSLLSSHLLFAWSDANVYTPITQSKSIFPLYYPLTAESLLKKLNLADEKRIAENKKLYQLSNNNTIQYPLHKIKTTLITKPKNILYLIIDSWRYNCMDSVITPNIYKLSQQSQHFTNHHSGSNATADGMFTLFYGISGLCNDNFTNSQIAPLIFTEAKKQNYQFNILGSATLENPPFDRNIFLNIPNLRLNAIGNSPSERDIDITNVWLQAQKKKDTTIASFDMLFYDSAHGYDYPENYPEKFKPTTNSVDYANLDNDYNPTKILNRYKNALHFIDSLIGRVIAQLKETNQLENTIIVVTGDHGQEFNDNKKGYWNHGGNYTKYQTHIPLLIVDLDKTPKTYNHLTLHYDITPTIIKNYLGIQNPASDYSIGKSLYNTQKRDWFICGFKNSYAIVEPHKITKINKNLGLFTITDEKLNVLKNESVNYQLIQEAFKKVNRFYKK